MGTRYITTVAVGALLAGCLLASGAQVKDAKGLKGRWVSEKFVWVGRESEEGEKMILVRGTTP